MPTSQQYKMSREELDTELYMEFFDNFFWKARGNKDISYITLAGMESFDSQWFTADTEAWAIFVLEDKEEQWRAKAEGMTRDQLPPPKYTKSNKNGGRGYPFGMDGCMALQHTISVVQKERNNADNNKVILDAVKAYYSSKVKPKVTNDARLAREETNRAMPKGLRAERTAEEIQLVNQLCFGGRNVVSI